MTAWFRLTRLRLALLLGAIAVYAFHLAAAPDISKLPKPTGYVSDLAHVVSAGDQANLEQYCTQIEQQLGVQLAIVTIDSLDDTPIEDFTLNLFRAWGIGSKKDNSGVLLLLAVKDRKSRTEVGRGVEPYVTDGMAGSTLRAMRPLLRANNYGGALLEGAREIAADIAKGKGISFNENAGLAPRPPPEEDSGRSSGIPITQIIIGVIAVLFVLSLFGRGGRGGGGGFWTGFLLSTLLNSGSGRGGGSWGGGGGFGGGSGGGGGFGGFGGGDSGGGGASSDW